ncbi:hypothetical protein [Chryseobacterium sp.]|uniref:hypothetical protein n=1 Tax=Chryseobacterium sp. TaxID=1871047 RepID=UPI00289C49CF|nr:hypothetical protein [Chryseobacterium sp.]
MENKKEIIKQQVMSEFLEDRILILYNNASYILPSKEHIEFFYYDSNNQVHRLLASFEQIVDRFKEVKK